MDSLTETCGDCGGQALGCECELPYAVTETEVAL